jgi:hypothetical protein
MNKKELLIGMISLTLFIILPIGIISIIMGAISPGSCDYTSSMNLNITQYLLGLGIANVITCVALIIFCVRRLYKPSSKMAINGLIIVAIVNTIFGIAWFIIGGIILFENNKDCILNGSVHIIYALVLWCITALIFLCISSLDIISEFIEFNF